MPESKINNILTFLLEWINNNKEWLFSGIGVVILGFVVRYIFKFFQSKRNKSNQQIEHNIPIEKSQVNIVSNTETSPQNGVSLEPKEIICTIKSSPLLQQNEVAKHYVGIDVVWKGTIASLDRVDELPHPNDTSVLIDCDNQIITCKIDSSEYSTLGIINAGQQVEVEGTIDKIEYGIIYLKNTKLNF